MKVVELKEAEEKSDQERISRLSLELVGLLKKKEWDIFIIILKIKKELLPNF
mgnify:CR=1 FL=1